MEWLPPTVSDGLVFRALPLVAQVYDLLAEQLDSDVALCVRAEPTDHVRRLVRRLADLLHFQLMPCPTQQEAILFQVFNTFKLTTFWKYF